MNITVTYDGSATAPANAGRYAVIAAVNDANFNGQADGNNDLVKNTQNSFLIGSANVLAKDHMLTPLDNYGGFTASIAN